MTGQEGVHTSLPVRLFCSLFVSDRRDFDSVANRRTGGHDERILRGVKSRRRSRGGRHAASTASRVAVDPERARVCGSLAFELVQAERQGHKAVEAHATDIVT
jgi:hypothetical protein